MNSFFPILTNLRGYKRQQLQGDLFAGVTVGVMLVPQGMAYSMIAGLPPVYGLYASITPQIIYAIFGTSRKLSVAPVATDSLLVATGVSVLAIEGTGNYIGLAILLAFLVGLIQLLLGIFRMGFVTNLLSKPVINGFISAAALIIGLNQLKYLLGIETDKSSLAHEVIISTFRTLEDTNLLTALIGIGGILLMLAIRRLNQMKFYGGSLKVRIPESLAVVLMSIGLVRAFELDTVDVDIIGLIPAGMPFFTLPIPDFNNVKELFPLAVTISVVSFMEAFSVAKALEDEGQDSKIFANQELVALGMSNLLGSLFQSFPVTGGFSRSAVNKQAGVQTSMASFISATVVGLALVLLTSVFYYIPKAVLASIIIVSVWNLLNFKYAILLWKQNKIEFLLLLITFLVTLNFSMVPGLISGVVLSILILLYRLAYPHIAELGRLSGQNEFRNINRFRNVEVWPHKLILRIDAPLTFINIQYLKDHIERTIAERPTIEHILIDASAISHLDATAISGIQELLITLSEKGIELILTELVGPVRDILFKSGLLSIIKEKNIYLSLNDALEELETHTGYSHRQNAIQHGELENNPM